MTLKSMTGFARVEGSLPAASWYWEIKTVNAKGIDIRTRIPSFLEGLEIDAKKMLSKALSRGSVFVSLNIEMNSGDEQLIVNESLLENLIDIAGKYEGRVGLKPASLDGLLGVKGVLEVQSSELSTDDKKQLLEALKSSLSDCIKKLVIARTDEGKRMQDVLTSQLDEIKGLVDQSVTVSGDRLAAMQARFKMQLDKLYDGQGELSQDRLAQEIATIAVKADIQEEIDRLYSHIEEARKLMSDPKAVGRRLDFLIQEFNREANTLCSKSNDVNLTRIGIDLKTIIDQFREQIQNIE